MDPRARLDGLVGWLWDGTTVPAHGNIHTEKNICFHPGLNLPFPSCKSSMLTTFPQCCPCKKDRICENRWNGKTVFISPASTYRWWELLKYVCVCVCVCAAALDFLLCFSTFPTVPQWKQWPLDAESYSISFWPMTPSPSVHLAPAAHGQKNK